MPGAFDAHRDRIRAAASRPASARAQRLLRARRRGHLIVITRTRSKTWTFSKPFTLKGVDRPLPAGDYRVTTDEELIEGWPFPVYRRVATMIFVPGLAPRSFPDGHGLIRRICRPRKGRPRANPQTATARHSLVRLRVC